MTDRVEKHHETGAPFVAVKCGLYPSIVLDFLDWAGDTRGCSFDSCSGHPRLVTSKPPTYGTPTLISLALIGSIDTDLEK